MKIVSLQQYRKKKFDNHIKEQQTSNKEIYIPAVSTLDANLRIYLFMCYIKKEFDEYVPNEKEYKEWKGKCEKLIANRNRVTSFYFAKVIQNGLDEEKLLFQFAPKWFFTWALHYFLYFKCKDNPRISKEDLMKKYGLTFESE